MSGELLSLLERLEPIGEENPVDPEARAVVGCICTLLGAIKIGGVDRLVEVTRRFTQSELDQLAKRRAAPNN